MTELYFAYGSNLNWVQIEERCPSAQFVGKARLEGWRFAITRYSHGRKCGVADIVESSGDVVWGEIYTMSEKDLRKLDKSEGYNSVRNQEINAYIRFRVTVHIDDNPDNACEVWTYQVQTRDSDTAPPSEKYYNLIVSSARHWGFPEEYVDQLKITMNTMVK